MRNLRARDDRDFTALSVEGRCGVKLTIERQNPS